MTNYKSNYNTNTCKRCCRKSEEGEWIIDKNNHTFFNAIIKFWYCPGCASHIKRGKR